MQCRSPINVVLIALKSLVNVLQQETHHYLGWLGCLGLAQNILEYLFINNYLQVLFADQDRHKFIVAMTIAVQMKDRKKQICIFTVTLSIAKFFAVAGIFTAKTIWQLLWVLCYLLHFIPPQFLRFFTVTHL